MKRSRSLSNKRTEQAYKERDNGGAVRKEILNWRLSKNSFPGWFKTKVDMTYKFDIVPYEIKSKNHPEVAKGNMQIGDLDFMLDIFVHRKVGPNEEPVVCPKKNYGKKCPMCEQSSAYYEKGDKEGGKALAAQRRVYFNVRPYEKGEPADLKIFEVSHYLFAKELLDEAKAASSSAEPLNFADPDEGNIISFRTAQGSFKDSVDYKSFKFLDREDVLEDELIDEAISFDELLIVKSYEEIEAIMNGSIDDDEDEQPAPKKKSHHDDDDEDERPAKRKKAAVVEDDEDERPSSKKKPAQDDDEDERPAKRKKAAVVEDDEDEQPAPKKSKAAAEDHFAGQSCPHGHKWGEDCDSKKECKRCPHWDACMDAQ